MVWLPSLSRNRKWPRVTNCTHSRVVGLRCGLEGNLVLLASVCVCSYIHILRGQIRARTWCCEVMGGCKVRSPTSSQSPRKWMLRRPVICRSKILAESSLRRYFTSSCGRHACILTFMWLRGKIRVGEWCYDVVGSCEVEQVARCGFLLPHNLIRTCMCVYAKLKNDWRNLVASEYLWRNLTVKPGND